MTARRKDNEGKMAAKKKTAKKATRKIRSAGEKLPAMIDSARVIRALEGTMREKQFIKAYDEAAGQRGAGLKKPKDAWLKAYKTFQKNGDFEAFADALNLDSQKATAAMGRLVRWEYRDK